MKELDFAGFNPERGQVLPERYAGYSLEYSGEMVGTVSRKIGESLGRHGLVQMLLHILNGLIYGFRMCVIH